MRIPAALTALALTMGTAHAELPGWLAAGERLTFKMTWIGMTAGKLELEARQSAPKESLRLSMRATSAGLVDTIFKVDDTFETIVDPQGFTVLRSTMDAREGKRHTVERVVFDPVAGTAQRWKNDVKRELLQAPPPIMDTLGAMYYLRTLPLAPGRTFEFDVQSGSKVYPMQVVVGERRREKTDIGRLDILVVEPRFANRSLLGSGEGTIWVTAEPPHTLVRISSKLPFGSLIASIASVERPR